MAFTVGRILGWRIRCDGCAVQWTQRAAGDAAPVRCGGCGSRDIQVVTLREGPARHGVLDGLERRR
jgi:rRNA maturation endonuclease Nob1